MNISITFEESVKGGIKVRIILFRYYNMKKRAHVQLVKEVGVNQALNHKNVKAVKDQACKLSGRGCLSCKLLVQLVEEKDKKLKVFARLVQDLVSRERK